MAAQGLEVPRVRLPGGDRLPWARAAGGALDRGLGRMNGEREPAVDGDMATDATQLLTETTHGCARCSTSSTGGG